jgi:hypothetical protein
MPASPADAINATSAIIPLQGDAYEHVERAPPLGQGGGVPPFQVMKPQGLAVDSTENDRLLQAEDASTASTQLHRPQGAEPLTFAEFETGVRPSNPAETGMVQRRPIMAEVRGGGGGGEPAGSTTHHYHCTVRPCSLRSSAIGTLRNSWK